MTYRLSCSDYSNYRFEIASGTPFIENLEGLKNKTGFGANLLQVDAGGAKARVCLCERSLPYCWNQIPYAINGMVGDVLRIRKQRKLFDVGPRFFEVDTANLARSKALAAEVGSQFSDLTIRER